MKKKLLFVDDDPNLLMGLQRGLHGMREAWEMDFVPSGDAALMKLAARNFDVVVSDMRMPGMTGLELLNHVQEQYPQTIRILLSGQVDRESILNSVARAHQYLPKPCDSRQLRTILSQTMALADLLENAAIKAVISRLTKVPSLPSLYMELTQALSEDEPSPARIGKIISRDIGMTAKILQIANSGICGIRADITQPEQAVLLLGLDTVQALVLSLSAFSSLAPGALDAAFTDSLWRHGSVTSLFASNIALAEGIKATATGSYLTAGLLHDIGKLIIATADHRLHKEIVERASAQKKSRSEVEQELLGCTHGEIGAFLLGIWGLPFPIVEAVAWHHKPGQRQTEEFSPLVAVHISNALHGQLEARDLYDLAEPDLAFLEQMGLAPRMDGWTEKCEQLLRDRRIG